MHGLKVRLELSTFIKYEARNSNIIAETKYDQFSFFKRSSQFSIFQVYMKQQKNLKSSTLF